MCEGDHKMARFETHSHADSIEMCASRCASDPACISYNWASDKTCKTFEQCDKMADQGNGAVTSFQCKGASHVAARPLERRDHRATPREGTCCTLASLRPIHPLCFPKV